MSRKSKAPPFSEREVEQAVGFFRRLRQLPLVEQRRLLLGMRGSPQVRRLLSIASSRIGFAERHGCSMTVIEATTRRSEPFVTRGRYWSRHKTRIGDAEGVIPSLRMLPDNAVEAEDRYDGMTPVEAARCPDPPSLTGLQFIAWAETLRARDERVRRRRARIKSAQNRKVVKSRAVKSLPAA